MSVGYKALMLEQMTMLNLELKLTDSYNHNEYVKGCFPSRVLQISSYDQNCCYYVLPSGVHFVECK